jgi:capsular exopolysaccharide synthesis family protein
MSNIFDALQRAELESSGENTSTLTLATELLQAAEQKLRDSGPILRDSGPIVRDSAPMIEEPASPAREARDDAFDSNPPAPLDDLDRCPVLPVLIREDSRLVSLGKEGSLGAEKFRFLAVRLRHIRQSRPLKKILITSTIPEEGKSTVAANLACTLARRKPQKTLLLEGDLRRPNIAAQFGLGKLPGLCEWLSGETPAINIYRLDSLGVWMLPAGTAPQNPLELMQSGKLSPLMEQLEAWFDWIIIDSPPVLPLADASLWSRLADGILLVTRKGTTEKQQLQRGLEAIDKSKLLGALVNSSANVAHTDYYQRYSSSSVDQSKE